MSKMGKTFLKCKIQRGPGLFEDERFVEIFAAGTTYTTIVDRNSVEEFGSLREGGCVEGRIRVYKVKKRGDNAFVILPREAAGHGRKLLVPQNLLYPEQ